MTSKKKLVFGLGSGRCGTASLAFLLSQQESTFSSHELFPILPWKPDMSTLTYKWTQLDHQAHLYDVVFDAGIYYFSYVPALIKSWNMHEYAKQRYDLKFVCLKRDKESVVESFLLKFKKQNNNPLQDHGDDSLVVNEWDNSFPKYPNDLSLREAIERFYDDYYEIANQYSEIYPENFKIFDTNCLNSESGVTSLLRFIGYERFNVQTGIQKRKH